MDKQEERKQFDCWIKGITGKDWVASRHEQFDRDEEAAEFVSKFDEELGRLFQRNIDSAREFYAYLLYKYGEEK